MESRNIYEIVMTKTEEGRQKCAATLLQINDPELRIIKGHLLIEEALYKLILFKSENSKAIEKARLTFAQQLAIVEGLYYNKDLMPEWLCPAASQLNKIRNSLAHNLSPKNIDEEIEKFTALVLNNIRKNGEPPLSGRLMYSIGNVHCGFLQILATHEELAKLPPIIRSLSFDSQITSYNLGNNDLFRS